MVAAKRPSGLFVDAQTRDAHHGGLQSSRWHVRKLGRVGSDGLA